MDKSLRNKAKSSERPRPSVDALHRTKRSDGSGAERRPDGLVFTDRQSGGDDPATEPRESVVYRSRTRAKKAVARALHEFAGKARPSEARAGAGHEPAHPDGPESKTGEDERERFVPNARYRKLARELEQRIERTQSSAPLRTTGKTTLTVRKSELK